MAKLRAGQAVGWLLALMIWSAPSSAETDGCRDGLKPLGAGSPWIPVQRLLRRRDPELRAFARALKNVGEDSAIDFRSSEPVTVFRAIGAIADIDRLNLNANYTQGLNGYGMDFVTHDLGWATHYGTYMQPEREGVLIEYRIPAKFLDIDRSTRKQEPYYVVSPEKLNRAGISGVAEFVVGIARIHSSHEDNRLRRISRRNDPRLEWLPRRRVRAIRSRSR